MRKMLPIGPLMIEHRLIERMIRAMGRERERMEREKTADPALVETMVDFIKTYADRCHHGKEEDILFRELEKKPLSDEHRRIMGELVSEHVRGRELTKKLAEAGARYAGGDRGALAQAVACMGELAAFYPVHIEKEDKRFFRPVMGYFSEDERNGMLAEGFEFDRALIHEKYRSVTERVERLFGPAAKP